MGFTGISLNIGTSIIAAMALGIAVDDTIHFLIRFRRALETGAPPAEAVQRTLAEGGKPVIYTSLTLCLGFLILALSDFAIIRAVGILTAITMITGILVEIFVTPTLMLLVPLIKPRPALAPATAAPAGGRETIGAATADRRPEADR
jgi:predicted RND superfamily exporter protein